MNDLKEWKKITFNFDDVSIWNKRKIALNMKYDSEFESYLHSLKNRTIEKNENFNLNSILEVNKKTKKKDTGVEIEEHSNPLYFVFNCISEYLVDYYTSTYDKYLSLQIRKSEDLEHQILYQIQNKIFNFIKPTIEYEYQIYLSAYGKKNDYSSVISFVNEITTSDEWILYYFESYPVLLSILTSFVENFKTDIERVLKRLNNDLEEIKNIFDIEGVKFLVETKLFLGDPHKGWQATALFRFCDSNDQIHDVYYKPKNLSGDIFFNNFVENMHLLGLEKSVQLTSNINKYEYGWQKGLNYEEINDKYQLSKFFYLQGINLALAYVLNIQDLIADNIIVNNSFPVLFDLEMIFLPQLNEGLDYRTKSKAGKDFLTSVIKTGIIPTYGFETANNEGYSNSGISKVSNNLYNVVVTRNDKAIIETFKVQGSDKNLPTFKNKIITVDNYIKEFEDGFLEGCSFIMRNRNEVLDFIIKSKVSICNIQTRILIRLTYCYTGILNESYSPLSMSNYYEYYKLLEFLWRGYERIFLPEQIIQNEINQLVNNEIPYFLTYPTSKDLYDGQNNIIVKDYFKASGFDYIIERIKKIDKNIINEQVNIIRRSLYVHNNYEGDIKYQYVSKQLVKKSSDILVNEIGEFLYQLNREDQNGKYFSYIDYTLSKDDLWSQGIQNCDMFQGIESVGIFFTALYSKNKEKKYLSAAKKIFNQSLELLLQNRNVLLDYSKTKIGLVNFPVSTFYFSLLGNRILKDNYFNIDEEVLSFFLDYLEVQYKSDKFYCYFSGSTGLLLLLIEYYNLNKSQRIYNLILKLGKRLVDSALELENKTITWEKPFFDKWGGFVHGNSSTSYALFKLADLSNNEIFFEAAIKALKYDQSLFDTTKQIWRKSIDFEGDIHHSWGNGSAGIGLSRFLISNYYSNKFLEDEINISIKNIDISLSGAMNLDHSIGSGLLGMIEIRKILDPSFNYEEILYNYVQSINSLNDIKCGGWNKNPLVTGLFYGFAGVGYNLLKLTNFKEKFPSLLWL